MLWQKTERKSAVASGRGMAEPQWGWTVLDRAREFGGLYRTAVVVVADTPEAGAGAAGAAGRREECT